MDEKKIIKLMEMVTILFLDGVISFHERDELLMRCQIRLDKLKEAKE